MKYSIRELKLKFLNEVVTNKEIICDNFGWFWELTGGGENSYTRHKYEYIN